MFFLWNNLSIVITEHSKTAKVEYNIVKPKSIDPLGELGETSMSNCHLIKSETLQHSYGLFGDKKSFY